MGIRDWFRSLAGEKVEGKQGNAIGEDMVNSLTTSISKGAQEPQLLFLSRFLAANDVTLLETDPRWEEVLGRSARAEVRALEERGLLQPATLTDKLLCSESAKRLKEMCRDRGIAVSGTKDVLAARLVDVDRPGVESLYGSKQMLSCTQTGLQLANAYLARADENRAEAEREASVQLAQGDYREALRTVARFESKQVFSRGMGIDWRMSPSQEDELEIQAILTGWPQILNDVPMDLRPVLRIAAGHMRIWGESRTPRHLRDGLTHAGRFDFETATRMLMFYGGHIRELASYRSAGIRSAEVTPSIDEDVCPACKAAEGTYRLAELPELPIPKCTSPMGCRCCTMAVLSDA